MSDSTVTEQDVSMALSASRVDAAGGAESDFFIDDYSHLRLSYYQRRDDSLRLDVSELYRDSAYSTNSSTCETVLDNKDEGKKDETTRKIRAYFVSQIPDLPHPAQTAAGIIASASHGMDPRNRFVYNKRIEQGNQTDKEVGQFAPERRSTLKPGRKL